MLICYDLLQEHAAHPSHSAMAGRRWCCHCCRGDQPLLACLQNSVTAMQQRLPNAGTSPASSQTLPCMMHACFLSMQGRQICDGLPATPAVGLAAKAALWQEAGRGAAWPGLHDPSRWGLHHRHPHWHSPGSPLVFLLHATPATLVVRHGSSNSAQTG